MRIAVAESIFERFPGYQRGLVVARGVSNEAGDPELAERLREAQQSLVARLGGEDWRAHPRVATWLQAFASLGIAVGSRPPSLAALVKRTMKGSALPFINRLVALMNITSLENLVPCGGDDLDAVGAEIVLRPATGTETYRPLGRPEMTEHPDPGEIVYVDTQSSVVLCRTWCWRNSDITKLTELTTAVALNLDLMAPAVPFEEGAAITERLAADMRRHCGGRVQWHMLSLEHPGAEVEI